MCSEHLLTARIPRVSVERQQSGEPLEGRAIVSWYPLHPSVKPPLPVSLPPSLPVCLDPWLRQINSGRFVNFPV